MQPGQHFELMFRMRQGEHAAPAVHHVEIQDLAQPVPHRKGVVVQCCAGILQIVGADDGGVAAGIAAAEPAFFQDRDIGDAVLRRQIVGGRESMTAGADNNDIVTALRFRIAPCPWPATMVVRRISDQAEDGIFGHDPLTIGAGSPPIGILVPRNQLNQMRWVRIMKNEIFDARWDDGPALQGRDMCFGDKRAYSPGNAALRHNVPRRPLKCDRS